MKEIELPLNPFSSLNLMSWNNDRGSEISIGESDEHWEAQRQREKWVRSEGEAVDSVWSIRTF